MPRDLTSDGPAQHHERISDEVTETPSPMMVSDNTNSSTSLSANTGAMIQTNDQPVKPYVQSLTMLDLESCIKLEDATFPPQERCSREKFNYRFSKCGELSIGLFTSADTEAPTSDHTPNASMAVTASTAQPVYSGTPARKQVLLAHVIATKTDNATVTDDDMALPPNWDNHTKQHDPKLGHKENGRTICVHSLAVLPAFQGRGLGTMLFRSYIQRIESSGLADNIALISHDHLVTFYEGMGFENRGPSKAQFGGGNWIDMVLPLKTPSYD